MGSVVNSNALISQRWARRTKSGVGVSIRAGVGSGAWGIFGERVGVDIGEDGGGGCGY